MGVTGGHTGNVDGITDVYSFAGSSWTREGDLKSPRTGHAMAVKQDYMYIIGGHGKLPIERWQFKEGQVENVQNSNTLLNEYIHYPEVFHVPDDYFNNC